MNVWTKRLFIILTVGGGYCGVVFMTLLFPQAQGQVAAYILIVAMIATFAFGVFSGLRFIEDEEKGLKLLRWYFGIQIPILSSPILAYQLSSGAGVNLSWIGSKMSIFWRIGSEMGVWILQERPWGIGANVFALIMFLWVGRILKSRKKANQSAQTSSWIALAAAFFGSKMKIKKEPNQTAREQRAGCDLNRMCHFRSAFSVVQKGSLHARPRVSHR